MLVVDLREVSLLLLAMQSSQFITLVLFTVSVLSPCLPSPIKREEDPREIVKSESDKNEYRAVTLSNNIRCVLVSDRSTDMAAVEIRVGKLQF